MPLTAPLRPAPLRPVARLARTAALLLLPSGGQLTARRNAWAGMSAEASRGRDRRAAQAALDAAQEAAVRRAARGGAVGT